MDTESTGDSELSVTLPPSLYDWLDERASTLEIEREALLVQLLETHRSTAEMDEDEFTALFDAADMDGVPFESPRSDLTEQLTDLEHQLDELDTQLDGVDMDLSDVDGRVRDLDAKFTNNVEDLRNRVLQLRDAIDDRAPADHSHEDVQRISERLERLSDELAVLRGDARSSDEALWWASTELGSIHGRLEAVEHKLDRLARALVAHTRRIETERESTARLDSIRHTANERDIVHATCAGCGESVHIGLLTEAVCPHCDRAFRDVVSSSSIFKWFRTPTLTVSESPGTEADTRHE